MTYAWQVLVLPSGHVVAWCVVVSEDGRPVAGWVPWYAAWAGKLGALPVGLS